MQNDLPTRVAAEPWNKGKLVGQKPPPKRRDIWAIRIRRQLAHRLRDLAMCNLAIDSKLRGGDLTNSCFPAACLPPTMSRCANIPA
jgi:hypothetical protein